MIDKVSLKDLQTDARSLLLAPQRCHWELQQRLLHSLHLDAQHRQLREQAMNASHSTHTPALSHTVHATAILTHQTIQAT
jgi:hypothetical protein